MNRKPALMLILFFALLAKVLIPSGWMPTGQRAFEIAICTGIDTHSVWLDDKGQLHKQDPGQKSDRKADENPCAFAGLAAAADLPAPAPLGMGFAKAAILPQTASQSLAIGKGLAAPPPPATGPPLLI